MNRALIAGALTAVGALTAGAVGIGVYLAGADPVTVPADDVRFVFTANDSTWADVGDACELTAEEAAAQHGITAFDPLYDPPPGLLVTCWPDGHTPESTTSTSSTTAPTTTTTSTTVAPTTTAPPTTTTTTTAPPTTTSTTAPPSSATFTETFDGNPASPQPFTEWDTFVRHRDLPSGQMIPVDAQHGADCGPPPATHHVDDVPGMIFLCRDHMMTAIDGGEYGALYLTPPARVDFAPAALNAAGVDSAEVSWNISTGFASGRDWWDVWILPVDEQYPGEAWYPDQGPGGFTLPPNGVHIALNVWERGSSFRLGVNVWVIRNGTRTLVNTEGWNGINWAIEQCGGALSDTIRDKFTLRISETSLSLVFTPVRNGQTCPHWFVNPITIPPLGWTDAAVKFGHHSYNPFKDGQGDHAGTWHWDDIRITPAR